MVMHSVPLLLAASEGGGGVAVLGLDAGALLLQIATFVVVFLILRKYAFGPIIANLESRRVTIEEGLATADEMRKAKEELATETAKMLADARKEAVEIVQASQAQAKEVVAAAEQKARERSDALVREAEVRIAGQIEKAKQGLRRQLAGLVAQATERVLGAKLDDKADAKLVEQATKEAQL